MKWSERCWVDSARTCRYLWLPQIFPFIQNWKQHWDNIFYCPKERWEQINSRRKRLLCNAYRLWIPVHNVLGHYRATIVQENEGLTSYTKCILKTTVGTGNRNWKELGYCKSAREKWKLLTKALTKSKLQ